MDTTSYWWDKSDLERARTLEVDCKSSEISKTENSNPRSPAPTLFGHLRGYDIFRKREFFHLFAVSNSHRQTKSLTYSPWEERGGSIHAGQEVVLPGVLSLSIERLERFLFIATCQRQSFIGKRID